MPFQNMVGRRALQGAGAGLAAGLFTGYARDDGSAGAGHYARHALGGAAVGAGVGAGVGAFQNSWQRVMARRRGMGTAASAGPAASLLAANPRAPVPPTPRAPLQLPASTGYDVAGRGQAVSVPARGPVRMGPMPQAQPAAAYTMGPTQVPPRLRVDERYSMGSANHIPRIDSPYKMAQLTAEHLFGYR